MKRASHPEIDNLGKDLADGEVYTVLLNVLDPKVCDKSGLDDKPRPRM